MWRKNRPSPQPLSLPTASSGAAAAGESRNVALSAAAAAQALRTYAGEPTNPADVVTKGMMRRSSSAASTSRIRTPEPASPILRRQGSSGSLAERTFRQSRSRSRSQSPAGRAPQDHGDDVPPVPSLPNHVSGSREEDPGNADKPKPKPKLAPSVQTTPFTVASQRKRDGSGSGSGSGSWYGPPTVGEPANVRTSDAPMMRPTTLLHYGHGRSASGNISPSVNFSRPRVGSPDPNEYPRPQTARSSTAPSTDDQTMVFDPNTRRMVTKAELLAEERMLAMMDEHAVRDHDKKKRIQAVARSGSHLAKGTVARTKSTSSDPSRRPSQRTATVSLEPRPKHQPEPMVDNPVPSPSLLPSHFAHDQHYQHDQHDQEKVLREPSPVVDRPPTPPVIAAQSVAVPDQDLPEALELEHDQQAARRETVRKLDGLPPMRPEEGRTTLDSPLELEAPHVSWESTSDQPPAGGPARHRAATPDQTAPHKRELSPQTGRANSRERKPQSPERRRSDASPNGRQHSDSPARSARFASSPEHLMIKHSPPARSASPRKSVLKHSSPTRYVSDDSSEASRDELPRKKSVRVSFEEQAVFSEAAPAAQDEPDSPKSSSAKVKRWFGLGKSADKGALSPLEEDDTMKPRPALPFFSSVREKKNKEPEERALVRPPDFVRSALRHSAPAGSPDPDSDPLSSRNAANISKSREPLPPVVTSVDGGGVLHELSDSDAEDSDMDISLDSSIREPAPSKPLTLSRVKEESEQPVEPSQANGSPKSSHTRSVPAVTILPPTPATENPPPDDDFFDLPGQFPDELEAGGSMAPGNTAQLQIETAAPTASIDNDNDNDNDDSDTGSSIYSDAYEDLSDMEGDGFMSLDAVLTSPINSKTSKKLYDHAMSDSPKEPESPLPTPPEPATGDDWEKVKMYWKNLSPEKRKQLEQEATEEIAAEGDLDSESHLDVPKKAKKKKSMERRILERQAVQQQNPERVYQIKPGTKMPPARDNTESPIPPANTSANASANTSAIASANPPAPAPQKTGDSVRIRKSMRDDSAPGQPSTSTTPAPTAAMRTTLRSAHEPSTRAPGNRPSSYQGRSSARKPAQHRRNQSADAAPPSPSQAMAAAIMNSTRERRNSDSSASSYQRAHPGSRAMRSSMRSGQADQSLLPAADHDERPRSRFSLRSLSPSGRPSSPRGPLASADSAGSLRMTMRSSGAPERTRMRMPSLTSKKTAKKGLFSSRFDDSSDDDVPRRTFQSRFQDSSDDEDAPMPAPTTKQKKGLLQVLGQSSSAIPSSHGQQRQREVDNSPDPESSDYEHGGQMADITGLQSKRSSREQQPGSAPSSIMSTLGTQTTVTSAGSLVQPTNASSNRRHGIMSALLRRKNDTPGTINKLNRHEGEGEGESGAGPDGDLQRTVEELGALRATSPAPRLQRRNPARLQRGRSVSDGNWPFPHETASSSQKSQQPQQRADVGPKNPHDDAEDGQAVFEKDSNRDDDEKRPLSADGSPAIGQIPQPGFTHRRSLSHGTNDLAGAEVVAFAKRKKKFLGLRRIFGLEG